LPPSNILSLHRQHIPPPAFSTTSIFHHTSAPPLPHSHSSRISPLQYATHSKAPHKQTRSRPLHHLISALVRVTFTLAKVICGAISVSAWFSDVVLAHNCHLSSIVTNTLGKNRTWAHSQMELHYILAIPLLCFPQFVYSRSIGETEMGDGM